MPESRGFRAGDLMSNELAVVNGKPDQLGALYYEIKALSASGMRDLAVSPLRFWHRHVNPARVEEPPTPEMRFGTALHCAVLEPEEFEKRYARAVNPDDYDGLLTTMDDLRQWLKDKGHQPKGTRKADVIAQVLAHDAHAPILDVLTEQHARQHQGKEILSGADFERVIGAFDSLTSEPRMKELLRSGKAEVPMFVKDPESGVPLKMKCDWLTPKCIVDVKTFSMRRDKPVDRAVTDCIWYEGYHRQAYLYSFIRALNEEKPLAAAEFVFAFVESEAPFEVRLRIVRPKIAGQVSLLWERARIECHQLVRTYAECAAKFGESPWRYACEPTQVCDEEIPALAYSY
jgi:hypothetical protein